MPPDPELEILVRRWLRKAGQDLALAERVINEGQFRELIAFSRAAGSGEVH